MVHGIARERQSPPLDRLRQDDARALSLFPRLIERVENESEIVPAHVGHRGGQRLVGEIPQRAVQRGVHLSARRRDERLPHRAGGAPQQRLVFRVRHRLEARPQTFPTALGEKCLEPPSPAQLDDAPAGRAEPFGDLAPPAVGRHAVETLAVDVHDPQKVAQPRHVLLEERLPHVPLVQLGVADHGDEASRRARAPVIADIASRQRGEGRRHRA